MNTNSPIKQYLNQLVEFLVYAFLYLIFVRLVTIQFINGPDYRVHIGIIDKYIQGNFYIPHPAFHLLIHWISKISAVSYETITPFFSAFVMVVTIFFTKKVLVYLAPEINYPVVYLFAAVAVNIAIAIYIPFFNREMYLGQWSPNIWHSPTMTLLKPFALLSFLWILVILKNHIKTENYIFVFVSACLLVSTFVKPSYIICLIPAIGIYLLLFHYKQKDLYLKMFWVILPSILLLAYQYIETYSLSQTNSYFHDNVKLTWFGVTKMRTKSVFISTILVTAFPISVLAATYKNIKQKTPLFFSWILWTVSFLVSGLLAEQYKFSQGAFIFSYIICLFILYVFSLGEYLNWFSEIKKNRLKIALVGIVFLMHLVSGILYLQRLLVYPSV